MPMYLIRFDDGRHCPPVEAAGDRDATEYAMELLLDDGAEPGEEAGVYRVEDGGVEEHIATVAVPSDEDE